jgi:hemerythrin
MVVMNEKMLTGIEKLDEQHKAVFIGITNVKEGIKKNLPKEKILEMIDSLDFYANEHFDYEEALAAICDFCRLDELKDAHNDFRNHYNLIKKFYWPSKHRTPKVYALHTAYVLEDWIKFHFESIEYEFIDLLKKCLAEGLDISKV